MSSTRALATATITSTVPTSTASVALVHGLEINENNKGPAVNLAIWISLVAMCIVVIAKVASRLLRTQQGVHIKNLQLDDFSILAAMVRNSSKQGGRFC